MRKKKINLHVNPNHMRYHLVRRHVTKPSPRAGVAPADPYLHFSRAEWSRLRASTELPLTEHELASLRGINERISLDEVAGVYLPLSRLLNLYVSAVQSLHKATDTFLGNLPARVPYIIGLAGSVAVGKSTTGRILQTLLSRWPHHPQVDLVATDGFLHPTSVLRERGLMNRKGFPESFDQRRLLRFLTDVKSGAPATQVPVYSHLLYDIVPDQMLTVRQPDILIVEGLNVLQANSRQSKVFVSDFFDFSVYIDAAEPTIQEWYVERFVKLRETVFTNPASFFHHYAAMDRDEAMATARGIWREINGPNLRENIEPTRERARLILTKGPDHAVEEIRLRKI